MKDKSLIKSLSLLSSPLSLAAILILAINSFIIRVYWPSWVTGKLSDFAWLYFTPFALAAILSLVIPGKIKSKEGIVQIAAFSIIFSVFVISNSFNPWNEWLVSTLSQILGTQIAITRDPTDLIALVSTVLAWRHWKRWEMPQTVPNRRALLLLPLCAMLVVADADMPNYGVECLETNGKGIFAFAGYYDDYFTSDDGGLTWIQIDQHPDIENPQCQYYGEWENKIISSPDGSLVFRLSEENLFEQSMNGGQTWSIISEGVYPTEAETAYYQNHNFNGSAVYFRGPLGAVYDPTSENFIFAMGLDGVLVRTPAGDWIPVAVGEYKIEEFSPNKIPGLIGIEMGLAIGLSILLAITIGVFNSYNLLRKVIVILLWADWFIMVGLRPAMAGNYDFILILPGLAFGGLFVVVLLIENIFCWVKETPANFLPRILLALLGGLAFIIPYILWTVNAVPSYKTSMYVTIAISLLIFIISFVTLRNKKSQISSNTVD